LSRWAYPASQALRDISMHGTAKDTEEMEEEIRLEREEEREMEIRAISDQQGNLATESKGTELARSEVGEDRPVGTAETQVESLLGTSKGKERLVRPLMVDEAGNEFFEENGDGESTESGPEGQGGCIAGGPGIDHSWIRVIIFGPPT